MMANCAHLWAVGFDGTEGTYAILHAIRELGGKVLKTNVDLERAKLIQSTVTANAETSNLNAPRGSNA